jgi:hypothetical protein
MREKLKPFIKFSDTRTVPSTGTESVGLAADAYGVMVFATPSRLFNRAPELTNLTRTWYRGTISSCTWTLQPSAGTCKNHATATRTATHQTAGPLGCNVLSSPSARLHQDSFAAPPGQLFYFGTNS